MKSSSEILTDMVANLNRRGLAKVGTCEKSLIWRRMAVWWKDEGMKLRDVFDGGRDECRQIWIIDPSKKTTRVQFGSSGAPE